jgi:hypothetical protein
VTVAIDPNASQNNSVVLVIYHTIRTSLGLSCWAKRKLSMQDWILPKIIDYRDTQFIYRTVTQRRVDRRYS